MIIWLLTMVSLGLMMILFLLGLVYTNLIQSLPSIDGVQEWFSSSLDEFPPASRVFDQDGETRIATLINPIAVEREWLQINTFKSPRLPGGVINAVVAAQDDSFWEHSGFDVVKTLGGIADTIVGVDENEIYRSIPQRLVYMTILPANDFSGPQLRRYLRSAIMAQNLVENYSKEQILEWYLNSAKFGRLTMGIDAASLVYFDKHASDLSLAEGAFLVALLDHPGLDPSRDFAQLKEKQAAVLAKLASTGMSSEREFHAYLGETIDLVERSALQELGLAQLSELEMLDSIGPVAFQRVGLKITSSIDQSLQGEVDCVTHRYLDRLSASRTVSSSEEIDQVDCESASFLPPLRPGDLGVDHRVNDAAIVAIDPQSGKIIALFGDVVSERATGQMTYPLLYLSAFARGFSPGSMVLDLPTPSHEGIDPVGEPFAGEGPLRMRNALVGGRPYAAYRTLELIGEDSFFTLLGQLGVRTETEEISASGAMAGNLVSASPLDLGYAYAAIANLGVMTGDPSKSFHRPNTLSPILITRVQDVSGVELYSVLSDTQSIISPPLAYLLTDVLSDSSARWSIFGRPNIYDMDYPTAVITVRKGNVTHDSWTIGFSPSLVIGVWVGNKDGERMYRMNYENGAASLWHALTEFTSSFGSTLGWSAPEDIVEVEVCDPSGQLVTPYCPISVEEVFIRGSEPVQHDTIYVPVRINRESGKLATITTPLHLIEEGVFYIPPAEARPWAEFHGLELPPREYDSVRVDQVENPDVSLDFPPMFSYLHGEIRVRGRAIGDEFHYYRLQYGQGLNPSHWIQIGEDHHDPLERGLLGIWDTRGAEGLYTLQLLVIDRNGKVDSDFVHVTVDNQKPVVELDPIADKQFVEEGEVAEIRIIAQAIDNVEVEKVELLIDDRLAAVIEIGPYIKTISFEEQGKFVINARAYDLAGNVAESEPQTLQVIFE